MPSYAVNDACCLTLRTCDQDHTMQCETVLCYTGTIPVTWALPGAFPSLQDFQIESTQVSGTLPPSWGANGSFPALILLELDSSPLTGTLPAEWADGAAFSFLIGLSLTNCKFSGAVIQQSFTCCLMHNFSTLRMVLDVVCPHSLLILPSSNPSNRSHCYSLIGCLEFLTCQCGSGRKLS